MENFKGLLRITCLVVPLLFACNAGASDSAPPISDVVSSTNDVAISSSDVASDTISNSEDSAPVSTADYGGVDGYQYPVNVSEADYWYDTGTGLSVGVNYRGSNMLENLKRGDIVYEATGFYGITGHTAIVEGVYYSEEYQQYYVRIIEAISVGVARSIITPGRMLAKEGSVYRIDDATETQIDEALSFIISQLGKPYAVKYAKSFSSEAANWYCSEIIWAAYYLQGFNLDDTNLDSPVFPKEIIESNLVSLVNLS